MFLNVFLLSLVVSLGGYIFKRILGVMTTLCWVKHPTKFRQRSDVTIAVNRQAKQQNQQNKVFHSRILHEFNGNCITIIFFISVI